MEKKSKLAETICSLRLARGMSYGQLSRKIGISRQAISCIENGKTACICETKGVIAICDFFGINREDFEDSQPKRKLKKQKSKTRLGELLFNRRIELNLTQGKLSKMVGCSICLLHGLETGESNKLSIKLCKALEKALNCVIPKEYFSPTRGYLRRIKSSSPLGDLVFSLRLERGLTKKELAEISGTTAWTIRRMENGGGGNFRVGTIKKIFKALKSEVPKGLIPRR